MKAKSAKKWQKKKTAQPARSRDLLAQRKGFEGVEQRGVSVRPSPFLAGRPRRKKEESAQAARGSKNAMESRRRRQ